METLLNFLNLSHNRFRAVDGNQYFRNQSYSSSFENAKYVKLNKYEQTFVYNKAIGPSSVGLWLSYQFLMQEIEKWKTVKPIVCLEDDNDLEVEFKNLIYDATQKVAADWDIVLCGFCNFLPFSQSFGQKLAKVFKFSCTNCFIVRNSTTAKMIGEHLNLTSINTPVDLFLSSLAEQKKLQIYTLPASIAVQRRDLFKTDIPTSGSVSIAPLKNSLISFIQKLKFSEVTN